MKYHNSTHISCVGKRFSIKVDVREVARAYLYVLTNDLHPEPFGLLEDVFVAEDIRGEGLGKEIVGLVIASARGVGCYKLIATSRNSRDKVHNLYRDLGFVEHGKEFRIDF